MTIAYCVVAHQRPAQTQRLVHRLLADDQLVQACPDCSNALSEDLHTIASFMFAVNFNSQAIPFPRKPSDRMS